MFEVDLQAPSPGNDVARERLTTPDEQTMCVQWRADDRFDIQVREHRITVDQPVAVGGVDAGPTPTELFVAGLASCVAFYARRYLRRHHIDPAGLEVTTTYRMGTRPARVAGIEMEIHVSAPLTQQRRAGLLAQAAHCTVHNSLTQAPEVEITLAQPRRETRRDS